MSMVPVPVSSLQKMLMMLALVGVIEYKDTFFLWDCKYYTEFFCFFSGNMPIVLPKAGKNRTFRSIITILLSNQSHLFGFYVTNDTEIE